MHFIHDGTTVGILDNLKDVLRHKWFYHSNYFASCAKFKSKLIYMVFQDNIMSMVFLRNFVVDILAIILLSFPVFVSIQGIFCHKLDVMCLIKM